MAPDEECVRLIIFPGKMIERTFNSNKWNNRLVLVCHHCQGREELRSRVGYQSKAHGFSNWWSKAPNEIINLNHSTLLQQLHGMMLILGQSNFINLEDWKPTLTSS